MYTFRLLTLSAALGILAAGSSHAGDPLSGGSILDIGVPAGMPVPFVGQASGPILIPQTYPQEVYHKLRVNRLVTETVFVPETITRKVVRQVYRKVPSDRLESRPMLVPEKRQELQTRMTYQETKRHELETRLVYVPEKRDELQSRPVYRQVKQQEARCYLAYVPVKTQQVKTCMVYVEKRVEVTRLASRVRLVDSFEINPTTGESVRVQKPVCYQEPVVETVKSYVLEPKQTVETVTEYRLEQRTEMVDGYALSTEMVSVPTTSYRPEMRTQPRQEKAYDLVPKTTLEEVTHYRHEMRLQPKEAEYCLVWEEALVEENVYRCQTRTELREVDLVIRCHGEAIRTTPAAHLQTMAHRQVIDLPCDCHGAAVSAQGGSVSALGAMSHAPTWK